MKKFPIVLLIGLTIFAIAATDYAANVQRQKMKNVPVGMPESDPYPNLTQNLLDENPLIFSYKIDKRTRTNQIFERFDMSTLSARVYRNDLESETKAPVDETGTGTVTVPPSRLLTVYEVQGPENQGGLTYLNLKLKLVDQIDATGAMNESSQYGQNSFFYNDLNHPDTAYLVTQIKDNVYGFQYGKTDEETFKTIKAMINSLMETK